MTPAPPTRPGLRLVAWLLGLLVPVCACSSGQQLTIFCAASLARVTGELARRFERDHPGWRVIVEPSGSQVAARKVAELGRRADLVLSADWRVLERQLLPAHSPWLLQFASNELVLAYGPHSPGADKITAATWPAILLRPGVRLARADERTAPIGFQTLQAWKLAELHFAADPKYRDLGRRLRQRVEPRHVVDDVERLVGLLQARAVDYAFVFRTTAEEKRLQFLALPAEVNLGDPERASGYARAAVAVEFASGRRVRLPAQPIVYGAAIPTRASHPRQAAAFLGLLLNAPGAAELRRSGFRPLQPSRCRGNCARLPAELRGLVAAGKPTGTGSGTGASAPHRR